MSRLAVSLLGSFQAYSDDKPLTGFRSDKTRALLAYLAEERDRPHARTALAGLLWPDFPDTAALTNLRSALANLRHLLGDDAETSLLVTATTLQFHPAAAPLVDSAAYTALAEGDAGQDTLAAAVALYRGPFLEDFFLGDCPAFEEWLLIRRAYYERRQLDILQRLASLALDGRNYAAAVEYARRQLALSAWDETAHRQLMTAYALSGRRGAALAQYAVCRTVLAEELGAEPAPETTELYLHIRAGHFSAAVAPVSAASSAPSYMLQELAPFVARREELAQLDAQLDAVLAGTGRVVFVRGDAGSGKTALLYAFARRATGRRTPVAVADGRCSNYHGSGDSFLPFREIIQFFAATGLLPAHQASGAPLPLIAAPRRPAEAALSQQGDLYEQVTALLQEAAARRPLILLLDDLQWADRGTLDLLFHLGRRIAGCRILVVAAYRPEDVAQGEATTRHPLNAIVHELQRNTGEMAIDLNCGQGQPFIEALLDVEPNRLDLNFRRTLHRHTEGHALFTVELLHAMKERGALVQNAGGEWVLGAAPEWEHLPPRVEAVIAERVDRLPPLLRQVLDAASVQGETLSVEVLASSVAIDGGQLVWMLGELLSRQHGLVQADLRPGLAAGVPPSAPLLRYRFTHSLYQTYLYRHLDPARRAFLHRQAGEVLETLLGEASSEAASEVAGEAAALLAWHYEQGGCIAAAVRCRRDAGDHAMRFSACDEAVSHYLRGLALLDLMPASPARAEQELALQVALAAPLIIMAGWGGEQAHAAILRACALCQEIGAQSQLAEALYLLATNSVGRGEIAAALKAGASLLLLAQEVATPDALAAAHIALGEAHLFGGDLGEARHHLQEAVALLDACPLQGLLVVAGVDLRVAALTWLASALWAQGYLDQAQASRQAALDRAHTCGQPRTLVFALLFAGVLLDLQRDDLAAAQTRVAAVIELAGDRKLALYSHIADVYQGYLRVRAGEAAAGTAQMQAGLEAWQALGASGGVVQHFLLLSRAYQVTRAAALGLATVDKALVYATRYGMPYSLAELWRTRGELLLLQMPVDPEDEAAACFARALDVAQRQGARLWELRAALSLHLLRRRQGRQAETLPLLAAIYAAFDEGFALPDLRAVRALLETAGHPADVFSPTG